jgi:biopolymer transport protein ExbD
MSSAVMDESGEFEIRLDMNVIPLVDVMLVLLIIFLITIPAALTTIEVELPEVSNEVIETTPDNVIIAVDLEGRIYWNDFQVTYEELYERISDASVIIPQPEVHIRGDIEARFEFIGRVLAIAQRGGIMKVGFITNPEEGAVITRFQY